MLSVIIPAHNSQSTIGACLQALQDDLTPEVEVLVVDDGSTDGTAAIAESFGFRVLRLSGNHGPSAARNAGVDDTTAALLFFLDADIVMPRGTLQRILDLFAADSGLSAIFGSYEAGTPHQGLCTQYKNLIHHYTHQISRDEASTFCSGFGAIRREAFRLAGGFDPSQRFVEDIDLGYRFQSFGCRVRLVKSLFFTHLKVYTLSSLLYSDILNRAAPWTELMLRYRILRNDLNTSVSQRWSVVAAVLLPVALSFAIVDSVAGLAAAGLVFMFIWLNRGFLGFVLRHRGIRDAAGCAALHWLIFALSPVGVLIGVRRWLAKPTQRLAKAVPEETV